jgi:hypothetical protein
MLTALVELSRANTEAGIIVAVGVALSLVIRATGPALEGGASFVRAWKEKNKNR